MIIHVSKPEPKPYIDYSKIMMTVSLRRVWVTDHADHYDDDDNDDDADGCDG